MIGFRPGVIFLFRGQPASTVPTEGPLPERALFLSYPAIAWLRRKRARADLWLITAGLGRIAAKQPQQVELKHGLGLLSIAAVFQRAD
jgi:hypothetical protein